MAISNADIAALPTYTDAELLVLYRAAFVNGWGGTSRTINGRSITFAEPDKLLDIIERLEARITVIGADFTDGIALVQFGRPV